MLARARSIAMAALIMAACSGDGSGSDHEGSNPGTDGDADAGEAPNGGDGDEGPDPNRNPADACGNGTEALAPDLTITEIAVYQTIKVPVAQDGRWLTNQVAPIVQGKRALVRVFVTPDTSYARRTLSGVLTLDNGNGPKYLTDDFTPTGPSSDEVPASTLNFNLDGADIGPATKFSVAVVEKTCPSQVGEANKARFPATGVQNLGARKIGKLRVVVVPLEVNNNGLTPDTSPAQLEKMRETMLAYYPVPEVEISAHEPVAFTATEVGAWGQGWSEALMHVAVLRQRDRVEDDVYYYGVMTPANTLAQFCRGGGCVLGLAPQAIWTNPNEQVGLGIGYVNDETYTTMAHEIGHAHGLGHAPCGGANGVDPNFPNRNGNTDTWGWDSRTATLVRPTSKDIMGYCSPVWIGAYHFNALAERCTQVNNQFSIANATAIEWVSLIAYGDGTARWGGLRTHRLPGGESEVAIVKDAAGNVLAEVEAVRVTLSHSDDSFVYLPDPKPEWDTIVLYDRELKVSEILPAR